jgi:hypothetical protein
MELLDRMLPVRYGQRTQPCPLDVQLDHDPPQNGNRRDRQGDGDDQHKPGAACHPITMLGGQFLRTLFQKMVTSRKKTYSCRARQARIAGICRNMANRVPVRAYCLQTARRAPDIRQAAGIRPCLCHHELPCRYQLANSEHATLKTLPKFTCVQWTVCIIASIGFAFDIYELLMLPLIVRPALADLVGAKPGTPEFEFWVGMLFFVPAMAGGVFGLLGGYLTDLWGRRRVLVGSILLYAFSASAAGFATSIEMLLFLRCTTFIGVCVEFVAAVAWLAELFPEPKRREAVLGFTQAFSSLGGLLVTGANYPAIRYSA